MELLIFELTPQIMLKPRQAHTHTHTRTHTHAHTNTRMHIYIYIYIHTSTHNTLTMELLTLELTPQIMLKPIILLTFMIWKDLIAPCMITLSPAVNCLIVYVYKHLLHCLLYFPNNIITANLLHIFNSPLILKP